ncbi:MAG: type II/IV secretion system protein [Pedosphaera sp.]|nr:type II/IV secretion system protein [Pedosphaera sp.]
MSQRTEKSLQDESPSNPIDITTLVNSIILDAVDMGASDVHIEPWAENVGVRVRVNGMLQELVYIPLEFRDRIVGRIKVLANLASHIHGVPQDGKATLDANLGGAEMRVSIFPTVLGEKVVMRLFSSKTRSYDLRALGLDEETYTAYLSILNKPSGLILLTGPTGSGKTTAIYASIYYLFERHGPSMSITSVEDPVEVNLPMVNQAQLNPAMEFTYPSAMRSLMRQDPQVIMIGEIRDVDTAHIAVQAGMTGHLVISTIHSGTTGGVFARLINMEIEPFLLASSIIAVLGVRLVRGNCQHCLEPYSPDPLAMRMVPEDIVQTHQFLHGAGCDQCGHTGYSGRTAITELLAVNEDIREAVILKRPTRAIQSIAIGNGMKTLWNVGLAKAMAGQTTLEEVMKVVAADQM